MPKSLRRNKYKFTFYIFKRKRKQNITVQKSQHRKNTNTYTKWLKTKFIFYTGRLAWSLILREKGWLRVFENRISVFDIGGSCC